MVPSPARQAMEFRILGPLEVVEDGHVLDLGGQKQRALLAVLLLHANEVVSADRLIGALWPDRPPETAGKARHRKSARTRPFPVKIAAPLERF